MLHLKVCYNRSNLKHFIIFLLLFVSILILSCLIKCTEYQFSLEREKAEYRTVIINFKKNINPIEILDKNKQIEDFYEEDGQYFIIFKSTSQIDLFKQNYKDTINNYTTQLFNESNYVITKTIMKIILLISVVLITILILVFSLNFIYNIEKDIALYKLLGFSEKKILSMLAIYMYLLFLILYVLSVMSYCFVIKYLFFKKILNYVIFLKFQEIVFIFFFIIIIATLSFIRIIIKVRHTSPIGLIRSY